MYVRTILHTHTHTEAALTYLSLLLKIPWGQIGAKAKAKPFAKVKSDARVK